MQFSFILVHIGDSFPSYILDCINQIRKFNLAPIYLVISKTHNTKLSDVDVVLVDMDELPKTAKHVLFINRSKLNRKFRDGFWFRATERFFYIEDVMLELGLKNVIHLENDTLIYFNVSKYNCVFEDYYKIAAVFDNDERCIPCFMYISDVESMWELTQHIIDQDSKETDMQLLSSFRNKSNIIDNLPVIPKYYSGPLVSKSGKRTVNGEQYSKNVDLFNSIFDGAAIGQYLGGTDPRNKKGGAVGFVNESALFDFSNHEIYWRYVNGLTTPFIKDNNREYRINNLHIHSKRLYLFIS